MNEIYLGAIIGAVGSIAAAMLPVLYREYRNRHMFYSAPRGRRNALQGVWIGEGKDTYVESEEEGMAVSGRLQLEVLRRGKVKGTAELWSPRYASRDPKIKVWGGFYDNNYIQLSYRSTDPARVQLGVIVFKLAADGQRLSGHYAAFSPIRECFVAGELALTKLNNGERRRALGQ